MKRVFLCTCCRRPFARVEHGMLIIESRHGGEKHVNAIPLSEIVKLATTCVILSEEAVMATAR